MEKILNQVFALDGLLVCEDFTIRLDDGTPGEQIDGLISLDCSDFMTEVKWWQSAVGMDPACRHLVRLYGRASTGMAGLMISASGYTRPAIEECTRALTQRVRVLSDLQEIVLLLCRTPTSVSGSEPRCGRQQSNVTHIG